MIEVASPEALDVGRVAEQIRAAAKTVIKFATIDEAGRRSAVSALAAVLPDHAVFISGHATVTALALIDREIVFAHRDAFVAAVREYRELCAVLVAQLRDDTLPEPWATHEHGEHCRFTNPDSGQVVEAPLESFELDPYFLAAYLKSTAGYNALADVIRYDFHDTARIIQLLELG